MEPFRSRILVQNLEMCSFDIFKVGLLPNEYARKPIDQNRRVRFVTKGDSGWFSEPVLCVLVAPVCDGPLY